MALKKRSIGINDMKLHRTSEDLVYSYGRKKLIMSLRIFFGSMVSTALMIFLIFASYKTSSIVGIILFSIFIVFPILPIFSLFTGATIILTDSGITSRVAGVRLKKINWENVEKIRKVRAEVRFRRKFDFPDHFYFKDTQQRTFDWFFVNVFGDIVFTQEIIGFDDLLKQINFYAQENKISQVFTDKDVAIEKLRAYKGWSYWKRKMRPLPEVQVTKF